jgi:hypothetical protein
MSRQYETLSVSSVSQTCAIFRWGIDGAEVKVATIDFSAPVRPEIRPDRQHRTAPLSGAMRTAMKRSFEIDAETLRAKLYGGRS